MNAKKTRLPLTNAEVRTMKAGLLKTGTGDPKGWPTPPLGDPMQELDQMAAILYASGSVSIF